MILQLVALTINGLEVKARYFHLLKKVNLYNFLSLFLQEYSSLYIEILNLCVDIIYDE